MRMFVYSLIICITCIICGCQSSDSSYMIIHTSGDAKTSLFNDLTYVWENFIFTTNRVNEVK